VFLDANMAAVVQRPVNEIYVNEIRDVEANLINEGRDSKGREIHTIITPKHIDSYRKACGQVFECPDFSVSSLVCPCLPWYFKAVLVIIQWMVLVRFVVRFLIESHWIICFCRRHVKFSSVSIAANLVPVEDMAVLGARLFRHTLLWLVAFIALCLGMYVSYYILYKTDFLYFLRNFCRYRVVRNWTRNGRCSQRLADLRPFNDRVSDLSSRDSSYYTYRVVHYDPHYGIFSKPSYEKNCYVHQPLFVYLSKFCPLINVLNHEEMSQTYKLLEEKATRVSFLNLDNENYLSIIDGTIRCVIDYRYFIHADQCVIRVHYTHDERVEDFR